MFLSVYCAVSALGEQTKQTLLFDQPTGWTQWVRSARFQFGEDSG